MWPFSGIPDLPGIAWGSDGTSEWALTDEEKYEVRGIFRTLDDFKEEMQGTDRDVRPEAEKAMTAWALVGYAKGLVERAESEGSNPADRDASLRKALAALAKAYIFHPLPIYMFDIGCLLETLGEKAPALDAFNSFLEMQEATNRMP